MRKVLSVTHRIIFAFINRQEDTDENQNFIVIKIENTSDIEPIVINGRLKTHKDNAKLHGIGMNSISRALSAYNGSLDWKYNKEQKIFSTTIIIQNLTA